MTSHEIASVTIVVVVVVGSPFWSLESEKNAMCATLGTGSELGRASSASKTLTSPGQTETEKLDFVGFNMEFSGICGILWDFVGSNMEILYDFVGLNGP